MFVMREGAATLFAEFVRVLLFREGDDGFVVVVD